MYRILIPVDGNTNRAQKQAEVAASLPDAADGGKVTILHVFNDSAIDASSEMLDPVRVEAVNVANKHLEEQGISVELKSAAGDTVPTIIQTAEEIDADSTFVAGPKKSPTGKAVFGSVTQQVIFNAERPVMVTIDQ